MFTRNVHIFDEETGVNILVTQHGKAKTALLPDVYYVRIFATKFQTGRMPELLKQAGFDLKRNWNPVYSYVDNCPIEDFM